MRFPSFRHLHFGRDYSVCENNHSNDSRRRLNLPNCKIDSGAYGHAHARVKVRSAKVIAIRAILVPRERDNRERRWGRRGERIQKFKICSRTSLALELREAPGDPTDDRDLICSKGRDRNMITRRASPQVASLCFATKHRNVDMKKEEEPCPSTMEVSLPRVASRSF